MCQDVHELALNTEQTYPTEINVELTELSQQKYILYFKWIFQVFFFIFFNSK